MGVPAAMKGRCDAADRAKRLRESGGEAVYGAFVGDEVVGSCGLHRRSGPEVLEIGYWVHVDHLGRGYASEIAATLTTAAFAVPGIELVGGLLDTHWDHLHPLPDPDDGDLYGRVNALTLLREQASYLSKIMKGWNTLAVSRPNESTSEGGVVGSPAERSTSRRCS